MIALWLATGAAVSISFLAHRQRTREALLRALRSLVGLLPAFVVTMAAASLVLAALDPTALESALASEGILPALTAIAVGSIALIPGLVALPLAGVLHEQGASVSVVAGFVTSLLMVGVLTLPVEAKVLGWRIALLRNLLALAGAVAVTAGMAWWLG